MLEYTKTILEKVSFDASLFRKELTKALKWLRTDEALELRKWCISKFGNQHNQLFKEYNIG